MLKDFKASELQDDDDIVAFLKDQAEGRSFENDMKSVYYDAAKYIERCIKCLKDGDFDKLPEIYYYNENMN